MAILAATSRALALEVEVREHRGSPTLFVDNAPQVPMMFFGNIVGPEWETVLVSQVELAARAGVHLYSFDLNAGIPWAPPNGEPAPYAYDLVDKVVGAFLRADPQALLLPRLYVTSPPAWWYERHPNQRMLFSDGQSMDCPSVASKAWRQDVQENLRSLIRYWEEHHGDHVLGYHPSGQHTGEWFYHRAGERVYSGFEEPMREGFAEWARSKYRTVGRLREAWGQPDVTFETTRVPSVEEREMAAYGLFRDPSKESFVIDFHEYQQVAMVEPLEQMARLIKEETGDRKAACFFYGYYFGLSHLPSGLQAGGHLALERLLRCPDVDILSSPIDYFDRQPGGSGPFMAPVDSIRDAGKLWLNEDDTRTYLSEEALARADTPEATYAVHQRNFAHILPRRLACWYMDLPAQGWLNDAGIWENIAGLRRVYEREIARPASWQPEVAIIVDERSPLYLADNNTLTLPLTQFRQQFYRIGTGFRINLLSDVLAGRMALPKVALFVGCLHLTKSERAYLVKALRDRTAVWFYGSGYLDDRRGSTENMHELTGFSLAENSDGGSATVTFGSGGPLTEGVAGTTYGPETHFQPVWSVSDGQSVERLARYADGTTAAASRERGGGRSIYIGTTGCPAQLLRNILREAGVHLYVDSDDVLLTDGRFLSLTATQPGLKEIILPQGVALDDVYTQQAIAADNGVVSQELLLGETRQYWLRPSAGASGVGRSAES
jgi:hypothetical protein